MPVFSVVTAAPPTPNGDLHLGHLAGPYSGADVYTRACHLRGEGALYATGSDVHQSYVPAKARTLGQEPLAMAQGFADEIAAIFDSIGFAVDSYVRPQHSTGHQEAVRDFVLALDRQGRLERRTEDCLYCEGCERYLFEAYVRGGCPHCGVVTDGSSCEVCAWPNVCTDLADPRCTGCDGVPVLRSYQRLVFPLGRYTERLAEYHRRTVMSPRLRAFCLELTEAGLPDIPLSHPTGWGLPVPVAGFEDQRVYVWAEMAPGYLNAVAEALGRRGDAADLRQVWDGAEIVQFFGFDNGYFHAALIPALLMAYDEGLRLPDALLTNEFYELDAAKFSTSRRHAIWATDLLAHVPADTVRFVLALDRPEDERTDFTWQRFHALADGELAGRWQPWLASVLDRLAAGAATGLTGLGDGHRAQLAELARLAARGHGAYLAGSFSPRTAARTLCDLVGSTAEFAAAHPEDAATLAVEAAAAQLLAQLAHPVMPEFAERLWRALGHTGPVRWTGLRPLAAEGAAQAGTTFFLPQPADLEAKVMDR
ncbi:methionine--tRNA ligase [Kitasatospora cheerisanensis]|uniref:methionine--tRNA ligase n=1 Tax=Kitasatospora cheerisanensis KCTC 2395 TaxID=1348663 RepID=A0A066ZBQ2_9ACTN|nr:class I tRNA ligase family protein [Kitasatospora cheerisanensis]KDN87731.1 methionine-tRNA ligase [Kitasatospora cheerisanensis KCTC 2395]